MEREDPLVKLRDLWTRLATAYEHAAQDARSAGDRLEAWRCSVRANVYRQCAADLDVELERPERTEHASDDIVHDLLALLRSWDERIEWLDGLLRRTSGDVGVEHELLQRYTWERYTLGRIESVADCLSGLKRVLRQHGVIPGDDG